MGETRMKCTPIPTPTTKPMSLPFRPRVLHMWHMTMLFGATSLEELRRRTSYRKIIKLRARNWRRNVRQSTHRTNIPSISRQTFITHPRIKDVPNFISPGRKKSQGRTSFLTSRSYSWTVFADSSSSSSSSWVWATCQDQKNVLVPEKDDFTARFSWLLWVFKTICTWIILNQKLFSFQYYPAYFETISTKRNTLSC